jgi:transcriptional regulator with XRE-family HTH domain
MVTAYPTWGATGRQLRGMDWKQFGRYVKRARQDLELVQEELARRWGKSQTTVSEVERGVREVPREEIRPLATALERPIEEVWVAAGYSLESLAGFKGRETVSIGQGMKAFVVARDGEPGEPLDIDQSVIDQLLAHALLQKRRREGR